MGTVNELPYVTDWGWETSQSTGYIPKLTTLPIAEVACLALASCKCAKSYKGELQLFQGRPGMHPTWQMYWDLLYVGDWNYGYAYWYAT